MADEPEKKIFIDDDWKNQAQAEKQKLDKETDQASAGAGRGELPPANFTMLVNSLTTQALMALGGYEDPRTKRRMVDLELGKHHIDTLSMLEEKTKGNLDDDEKKLLDQALYELRMHYVQLAQRFS